MLLQHYDSYSIRQERCLLALLTAALVLALSIPLQAQTPVTIRGSERRIIKSKASGIEYQVDVGLPSGYFESGTTRYPVFYILDSNFSFASCVNMARLFTLYPDFPQLIIVGIGYREDDPIQYNPFASKTYSANRTRDYTPTRYESAGISPGVSGHSREFLTFIKDELIPVVDGSYRTDPSDRGLGGASFGGLFTTYALLTEPELFGRYWIGSPSLWWDHQVTFGLLERASNREPKAHGRAFLTIGAMETSMMIAPMERMAAELRTRFSGLEVGSTVFDEETHGSTAEGSVSRALRFLYGRWGHRTPPISRLDMLAYSGKWQSAGGEIMTLTPSGKKLMLTVSLYDNSVLLELLAESRDHLYNEPFAYTIVAERDASGRVVSVVRKVGKEATTFKRVK
jgi:predicted alpha/beta superfamily hydrolase